MNLILFSETLALCKLAAGVDPAKWLPTEPLHVAIHDPHGTTVICNRAATNGRGNEIVDMSFWRCFQIDEIFDVGTVGVVAEFSSLLAREQISVFVISSYETDFLLVPPDTADRAAGIFATAGHTIIRN